MAYKLELPSSSMVHPIFHVSQLKKVDGENVPVSASLPSEFSKLQINEKVLQQRVITRGNHFVPQILVKWSASPESLATWEDAEALKQQFLEVLAWGQAGPKGRGVLLPLLWDGLKTQATKITVQMFQRAEQVGRALESRTSLSWAQSGLIRV
jgi:hypothetical protein